MQIGNLLFPLQPEIRRIIRSYEKAIYKLNGIKTAILFNQVCLREGLLPNNNNNSNNDKLYSNIYIGYYNIFKITIQVYTFKSIIVLLSTES